MCDSSTAIAAISRSPSKLFDRPMSAGYAHGMDKQALIAALEAAGDPESLAMARWLREWDAPTVH